MIFRIKNSDFSARPIDGKLPLRTFENTCDLMCEVLKHRQHLNLLLMSTQIHVA